MACVCKTEGVDNTYFALFNKAIRKKTCQKIFINPKFYKTTKKQHMHPTCVKKVGCMCVFCKNIAQICILYNKNEKILHTYFFNLLNNQKTYDTM